MYFDNFDRLNVSLPYARSLSMLCGRVEQGHQRAKVPGLQVLVEAIVLQGLAWNCMVEVPLVLLLVAPFYAHTRLWVAAASLFLASHNTSKASVGLGLVAK